MKKFKELKDKQKVLAVFGILGLVLILTGVTYAFFSYSKEGTTENTLKSGSITFWYDEINQSGNSISIEDALPMTDEAGKQQTQAFNFKIQSTTSSTTTIPYEITLRQKQGTDDIGNIVKVYLAKTSAVDASIASEEEVELSLFSELSNVTKNTYSEKLLHTDLVPASDSPYTQFYRLKMWIDNNTDYSQVENETTHEMEYPYNNKTFTVTVNVYANGHVLDANSGTATVNSVSVGGTELTSTTVGGIDTYEATLPEGTTQTTLSVDTGDYDQVTVTKTQSDYTTPVAVNDNIQRLSNTTNKKVSLTDGSNYFKVVATSEDGNDSKEIHVLIKVRKVVVLQGLAKNIYDDAIATQGSIYDNPTLTNTSAAAGDASGLYESTATDSGAPTYYFRGAVNNNYVRFAGKDWRIVRINDDGTVRLLLNDYTHNTNLYIFSNSTMYYSESTVKNSVNSWFNSSITGDDLTKVAAGNYFCEAVKVKNDASYSTGDNNTPIYTSYTPDFTCNTDANGKGILSGDPKVALLTYDEAVFAGAYVNKNNNSVWLRMPYNWWTMSPAGYTNLIRGVWFVTDYVGPGDASANGRLRPVINLKANVTATKDANGVYVID